MTVKRILVVDDEWAILNVVQAYLEKEGFQVMTAASGTDALDKAAKLRPDVIILDLMLPDLSGEQVCARVRQESDVPILMLTAKTSKDEIVQGLALGADDYLTKPFSPKELAARVWALLRRTQGASGSLVDQLSYNDGTLVLDNRRKEVWLYGELVTLTRTEWDLLGVLARSPGRVWSRCDLIYRLRGDEYLGDDRTIDAHVKKLRAKLERDVRNPEFIVTVWGMGYKFRGTPDV